MCVSLCFVWNMLSYLGAMVGRLGGPFPRSGASRGQRATVGVGSTPPSPLPPGGSCQPAPPCDIKGVQIQATRFFLWYLVVCGPRCRPPPPPQALYLFPSGCWEARFIYCCVCVLSGLAAGGRAPRPAVPVSVLLCGQGRCGAPRTLRRPSGDWITRVRVVRPQRGWAGQRRASGPGVRQRYNSVRSA